jgi:histone acetyltransferase (RNA polymerase elongator complex component)
MKKHFIIPIFVPHAGCPHACVFCNQKDITGQADEPDGAAVQKTLDRYLQTILGRKNTHIEMGFFGGSFTGIPIAKQQELLAPARAAKEAGVIQGIRLSTRPDYINPDILRHLKEQRVDTVEIGVQSFSAAVLARSNRGHTVQDVEEAAALIRQHGFQLGIQLMVGLPEDTYERWMDSVATAVSLQPDLVRIYPTLVLAGTQLDDWMRQGQYQPLTLAETVRWCRDGLACFQSARIPVIRIGLQPTEEISPQAKVTGGPYHPAFRQLVESSLLLCLLEEAVAALPVEAGDMVRIAVPKARESDYRGQKNSNLQALAEAFPLLQFCIKGDPLLLDPCFAVTWAKGEKTFDRNTLLRTWVQGRQACGSVIQ